MSCLVWGCVVCAGRDMAAVSAVYFGSFKSPTFVHLFIQDRPHDSVQMITDRMRRRNKVGLSFKLPSTLNGMNITAVPFKVEQNISIRSQFQLRQKFRVYQFTEIADAA